MLEALHQGSPSSQPHSVHHSTPSRSPLQGGHGPWTHCPSNDHEGRTSRPACLGAALAPEQDRTTKAALCESTVPQYTLPSGGCDEEPGLSHHCVGFRCLWTHPVDVPLLSTGIRVLFLYPAATSLTCLFASGWLTPATMRLLMRVGVSPSQGPGWGHWSTIVGPQSHMLKVMPACTPNICICA
jgi:hypothetical protein